MSGGGEGLPRCGGAILAYCAGGLEPLAAILSVIQEKEKILDGALVVEELVGLVWAGYVECYFDSGGSMSPRPDISGQEIDDYLKRSRVSSLMEIPLAENGYYFETTDDGLEAAGLDEGGKPLGR